MSHCDHLGKAFANIVYAFLAAVDCDNYDASMFRLLSRCSPERGQLFDFLMKKKARSNADRTRFTSSDVLMSGDADAVPRGTRGVWCVECGNRHAEAFVSSAICDTTDTPALWLLEQNLTTSDLITQLTLVRNAYIENLHRQADATVVSVRNESRRSDCASRIIPVAYPSGPAERTAKATAAAVCLLCEQLRWQFHRGGVYTHRRGVVLPRAVGPHHRRSAMFNHSHAYLFSEAVEMVWAYSLCLVLEPHNSVFMHSGGLFRDAYTNSVSEIKLKEFPRLCDALPSLFLTRELMLQLESHLHDVLLPKESANPRLLLLAGMCYRRLGESNTNTLWRRLALICSEALCSAARRDSGRRGDTLDWKSLVRGVTPADTSEAEHESLAYDLEFVWRYHHNSWDEHGEEVVASALPILLTGDIPSFLPQRLGDKILVNSETAASPMHAVRFCHLHGYLAGSQGELTGLLELLHRLLVNSKKEKRLREFIALTAAGCLLPRSMISSTNNIVNSLLTEIDSWRKPKYAVWYALTTAALLGGCSHQMFLRRLPGFFLTLSSWFSVVDPLDRFAILHATLHVAGLLSEVCGEDRSPPREFKSSIEAFFQFVETCVLKKLGREAGRPPGTDTAFALLLFALQQPLFSNRAGEWVSRLVRCKVKSKIMTKNAIISGGQVLAMWILAALCEIEKLRGGPPVIVCAPEVENLSVARQPNSSGPRERLILLLTSHGSRFNPLMETTCGLVTVWRGDHPRHLLRAFRSLREFPQTIHEVLCGAFLSMCHFVELNSDDSMDGAQVGRDINLVALVHLVLAARFWVPSSTLLDTSLALPMQLAGPKTPLQDVVKRVMMPFFLFSSDDDMSDGAIALHRLAECVVVCLRRGEDERVEQLALNLATYVQLVAEHWERLVHDDLYIRSGNAAGVGTPLLFNGNRVKWDWLLNVLDMKCNRDLETSNSLLSRQEWCVVAGLRGSSLIDTLEGISLVLLGHQRRQVRCSALLLLETLSSLLRLHRLHNSAPLSTRLTSTYSFDKSSDALVPVSAPSAAAELHSLGVPSLPSVDPTTDFSRHAVADVLCELSEHFCQLYDKLKERYIYHSHSFLERNAPLESSHLFHSSNYLLSPSINLSDTTYSSQKLEKSLFGILCLKEEDATPRFVFISAAALTLILYCSGPGSAAMRVACAVAGDIALFIGRRYVDRGVLSSMWKSCYALHAVLVCVDNSKTSPDANRLTRGAERNRPGHQQGGNSTVLTGFDGPNDVVWRILNRHAEYQKLFKDLTVPILLHEIQVDTISPHLLDMLQFLFTGPLDLASNGTSSLVTYPVMMDSESTIIVLLRDLLAQRQKLRKNKPHVVHACLLVLLPILIVKGRRYFVRPPIIPGRMQDTVAAKRTKMETIIEDMINTILFGEDPGRETTNTRPSTVNHSAVSSCSSSSNIATSTSALSFDAIGRTLSEGHGVSARSWLALPFLPPFAESNRVAENTLNELSPFIVLRGFFCDLIQLVYSKEAKYFEPQLKNKLLSKVLFSLTFQVHWFLQSHQSNLSTENKLSPATSSIRHQMTVSMEKSILALQTVVSTECSTLGSRRYIEHTSIIANFARKFFKWLQKALKCNINLESDTPRVFDLAVTLLIADAASRTTVYSVLCDVPMGSSVHLTLFSILATAVSGLWITQEALFARRSVGSTESSTKSVRSDGSNETMSTAAATSIRGGSLLTELERSGICLVFYALAYVHKDPANTDGPLFDTSVRTRAQAFLELLCGEAPSDDGPLDDWLCLLLRANRRGDGVAAEYSTDLVQSLFAMAAGETLAAERKMTNSSQLQRIALRLLTVVLRSVDVTHENLLTLLEVSKACRNTCSDEALASLWSGWVTYEGREREQFVSLLVISPMDVADKRAITHYIDSAIKHDMVRREKVSHNGDLDSRARGIYYAFLLFCTYQMRLLRDDVAYGKRLERSSFSVSNQSSTQRLDRQTTGKPKKTGGVSEASHIPPSSLSFSQQDATRDREHESGHQVSPATRGVLWVTAENIWQSPFALTKENLKEKYARQQNFAYNQQQQPSLSLFHKFDADPREDLTAARETCFVRPLVNVLMFASWSMERLRHGQRRLWHELQRDTTAISKHFTSTTSGDWQLGAHGDTTSSQWSHSSEGQNSKESGDEENDASVVERSHSEVQNSSVLSHGRTSQNNLHVPLAADTEDGSDRTIIVHAHVQPTSVTDAMESDLKRAARRRSTRQNQQEQQQQQHRLESDAAAHFLQRDHLTLLLHLSCILLVHVGRMGRGGTAYLRVVESVFELVGSLLKGSTTAVNFRAPPSLLHWLSLTYRRLELCGEEGSDDSALALEPSLRPCSSKLPLDGCTCASVEILLDELFLGIVGHGHNRRGRRFLLRCLHESAAWASVGAMGQESQGKVDLSGIHAYITLLSLKVARRLPSCLALTTGVVIVTCGVRERWMEKTSMQLVAAGVLRQLLAALARSMGSHVNYNKKSTTAGLLGVSIGTNVVSVSPRAQMDLLLCSSTMASLASLLRDVVVHEMYYAAAVNRKAEVTTMDNKEERHEEELVVTPFGAKSSFPAYYLHSFFWSAFAVLLAPRLWPAACDVLAVFHRHGCARFLGTLSPPLLPQPHQHALRLDETPECIAVQLLLLHQGHHGIPFLAPTSVTPGRSKSEITNTSLSVNSNTSAKPIGVHKVLETSYDSSYSEGKGGGERRRRTKTGSGHEWCCVYREKGANATRAALNYLDAYTYEHSDSALLLALSELMLLCHWEGLSMEVLKLLSGDEGDESDPKLPPNDSDALSFSQCLRRLAGVWHRSRCTPPSRGYVGGPQSPSTLLSVVLGDFFQTAVRIFGVTSVDVLLRRVATTRYRDTHSTLYEISSDLCSLHSCVEESSAQHGLSMLSETSVLAFQSGFETFVMWPLMALFRSPKTPLLLWSKILALVSALIGYHNQKHGFITDLLLKFLPELEQGLDVGTMHDVFSEEAPFFDRLAVPILADEVATEVRGLRTSHTCLSEPFTCDARQPAPLVSIIGCEPLMVALVEHVAREVTLLPNDVKNEAPPVTPSTDVRVVSSLIGGRVAPTTASDETPCPRRPLILSPIITKHVRRNNDMDDMGYGNGSLREEGAPSFSENSSNSTDDEASLASSLLRPRRFGEYVYELNPNINSALQTQMSLEYYNPYLVEGLSSTLHEDLGDEEVDGKSLATTQQSYARRKGTEGQGYRLGDDVSQRSQATNEDENNSVSGSTCRLEFKWRSVTLSDGHSTSSVSRVDMATSVSTLADLGDSSDEEKL